MSLPTEIDFALIKLGDGESPEVFNLICGITDVTHSITVSSSDRFVRDCAKPGEVPYRKTRTNGRQLDVGGSGLTDVDNIEDLNAAIGIVRNYKIEFYRADGTDEGELLGTTAGPFLLTANNINLPRDGDASGEISLASHGIWTYTAA